MTKRTLLLTFMVLRPFGSALADDWPQWRGPDRTGVSKETGLLPSWPVGGPKLLWIFRNAGLGHSSMAVVGDRLYSMGGVGDKDYVYAVDLKTQKKLWSTDVGALSMDGYGDGPYSTPTVDGDFIYAIGGRAELACVEAATGRKVWSQHLVKGSADNEGPAHGYGASPLVDGGLTAVALGGKDGAIAAFDKKTGALKWRTATSTDAKPAHASLIAIETAGVRQYVHLAYYGAESMAGVRALDGKLLWRSTNGYLKSAIATPIFHNNCVYASCMDGCQLHKLVSDEGRFRAEQMYANLEMKNHYSGVVLVGEHLYGYSDKARGGWICQNFKTGKTVWRKDPHMGRGCVICADGDLYCYHERDGDVLLIKAAPTGYQERGRFRIPETTKLQRRSGAIYSLPVVADGKLYLRDQNLIFCYDIHKP